MCTPGNSVDPKQMTAVSEDARYRVCLCVTPALVSGIEDTAWPQGPTSSGEGQVYKLALPKVRDPFTDVSDQSKALHNGVLVSSAMILVEAIQRTWVWMWRHDRTM